MRTVLDIVDSRNTGAQNTGGRVSPRRIRSWSRRATGAVVAVVVAVAVVSRLDVSPVANDLVHRLEGPSWARPLGTDQLGRDVLARVVHGALRSLGLAVGALGASAAVGVAIGGLTGWTHGRVAVAVLGIVDAVAALPTVVVALVTAAILGPGNTTVLIAIAAASWAPYARVTHQLTRKVATAIYVEAAGSMGASTIRILRRHIWPNVAPPVLTHVFIGLPGAMLTVAGLSYLGLGPQPPSPEWGAMVAEALPHLRRAPLPVIAPAACIVAAGALAATIGRSIERRTRPRPPRPRLPGTLSPSSSPIPSMRRDCT